MEVIRNSKTNSFGVNSGTLRSFAGIVCGIVVVLFLIGGGDAFSGPTKPAVAVGDGFEITQEDVTALEGYFIKGGIRSTEANYLNAALRYKVFSLEAEALKLKPSGGKTEGKESRIESRIERWIRLSKLYLTKVLEEYPIDDIVIESYYRTYPKEFDRPLDDVVKNMIRKKIVFVKKGKISRKLFEELKVKYHVRLVDLGN